MFERRPTRLITLLAVVSALLPPFAFAARAEDDAGKIPAAAEAGQTADAAEAALPPAKKILVIAMVADPNRRGVVEEKFRAEFAALGLSCLTSVGDMSADDFATPEALQAKVKALGVDGVLGLAVENVEVSTGSKASIGVGVGVPTSGYGSPYSAWGPYGHMAYVGASKPIGDTTTTARTKVRVMFYNRPVYPAWQKLEKNSFKKDDVDVTAAALAKKTVKELRKKKLIAAP